MSREFTLNNGKIMTVLSCSEAIQYIGVWMSLKVGGDVLTYLSQGHSEGCADKIIAGLHKGFYGKDERFTELVDCLSDSRLNTDEEKRKAVHLSGMREALVLAIENHRRLTAEFQIPVIPTPSVSPEMIGA